MSNANDNTLDAEQYIASKFAVIQNQRIHQVIGYFQ